MNIQGFTIKKFIAMVSRLLSIAILICFVSSAFSQQTEVDAIVVNGKIYTVDEKFSTVESMAIKEGKIVATGSNQDIRSRYRSGNIIDAKQKFVYPGFIDAHAHFYRYSLGLSSVNLVGTNSWNQIINLITDASRRNTYGPDRWLIGRGWDQNDWKVKEFPTKEKLDQLFPTIPVLLTRIDGHAAIANQAALDVAAIKSGQTLTGGTIEMKKGKLTGILIDNAVGLVSSRIPQPNASQKTSLIQQGQANCFAVGLTTVDDCGIDFEEALFIDSLQKTGVMKMRVYAMLSDARKNYEFLFGRGKIKTDFLNVRSFKVYADGALGSRGASLLEPYADRNDWKGFLLSSQQHFDSVAAIIYAHDFQMCTHAIGDSGNRTILKIYGKYLKNSNDRRWRIEHAQVINANDFDLFGKYSIIPSVQPTHATSDMYWAETRLGSQRVKNAYAYKRLLNQNGWIPLGTDFPVEDISPIKTFYAAVFRVNQDNYPKGGFQNSDALTRADALRGMTIWAARSNFEEGEKGSLEAGKLADFVILDQDLMTSTPQQVLTIKVIGTYIGGKQVFASGK